MERRRLFIVVFAEFKEDLAHSFYCNNNLRLFFVCGAYGTLVK
jgi:hypothetical protein